MPIVDELEMAHPLAVPPLEIAYVTVPLPEPEFVSVGVTVAL